MLPESLEKFKPYAMEVDRVSSSTSSHTGTCSGSHDSMEQPSVGLKRKALDEAALESHKNIPSSLHESPQDSHASKRLDGSPSPEKEKILTINWARSPDDSAAGAATGEVERLEGQPADAGQKQDKQQTEMSPEDDIPTLIMTSQQLDAKMIREKKMYSYITCSEMESTLKPDQKPIDKLLEQVPPTLETDPPMSVHVLRNMSMAPIVGVQPFHREQATYRNNFAQTFAFGPAHADGQARPVLPQIPLISNSWLEPVYASTTRSNAVTMESIRTICSKILPASAVLGTHALEILQAACIEFTSIVSSEAGLYSLADADNRTGPGSVLGADIVSALEALGFQDYALFAKAYLSKFQAQQQLFRGK